MSLSQAERVADAILYEGYVLYPYRASAAKNRLRWQVGLVTPREYSEATGSDSWWMQTECLAETGPAATLTVKVRCLHVQERAVQEAGDPVRGLWHPVDRVLVDDRQLVTWDEAVVCEFMREAFPLGAPGENGCHAWVLEDALDVEPVHDRSGEIAARIVRRRWPVVASVHIATERCGNLVKIRVRVENVSPCRAQTLAERDAAVRQSLAGTHTLLAIEGGAFLSLLEPPPSAATVAAACVNEHTWPVLIGPHGSRAVMLSSPIILYDYPAVAPESPGDFCDATEIDEMLMLRVRTLTDEEKREGRATDERAAQIIDRADTSTAATMGSLHGAIRQYADVEPASPIPDWRANRSSNSDERQVRLRREAASADNLREDGMSGGWESLVNPPGDPSPETAYLEIGSLRIGRGSRVRVQPAYRADSLDLCLNGRLATVTGVYRTLEDKPYVAVTLDDDPLGASGARYRRALFFHPDEIVPVGVDTGGVT